MLLSETSAGTDASLRRHDIVMRSLSQRLDRLAQVLPPGSSMAYLDYPVHFNVGDLLINLGAEAFFARNRCTVLTRLSLFELCLVDWDHPQRTALKDSAIKQLRALPEETILVLHGGGNFGDIYPEFQVMRERIAATFPERRIVMLPQSAHFATQDAMNRSLEQLLRHPDLHLFFRDVESVNQLAAFGPGKGQLLPDMAHALWATEGWEPSPQTLTPRCPLVLSRTDSETASRRLHRLGRHAQDWPDLETWRDKMCFRALRKAMHVDLDPTHRLTSAAWYGLRNSLVERARTLFSNHGEILTDRLHGMLLATLMGLPVRFADNSYGKLSRYAQAWLSDSPLVSPARDEDFEWSPT